MGLEAEAWNCDTIPIILKIDERHEERKREQI
jgi:hypothetical protein